VKGDGVCCVLYAVCRVRDGLKIEDGEGMQEDGMGMANDDERRADQRSATVTVNCGPLWCPSALLAVQTIGRTRPLGWVALLNPAHNSIRRHTCFNRCMHSTAAHVFCIHLPLRSSDAQVVAHVPSALMSGFCIPNSTPPRHRIQCPPTQATLEDCDQCSTPASTSTTSTASTASTAVIILNVRSTSSFLVHFASA